MPRTCKALASKYLAGAGEECPRCEGGSWGFILMACGADGGGRRRWSEFHCWCCSLQWRETVEPDDDADEFCPIVGFQVLALDGVIPEGVKGWAEDYEGG